MKRTVDEGNKEFSFWLGKKAENVFISDDVGIRVMYLSLTLGTAQIQTIRFIIFSSPIIDLWCNT